MDKDTIIVTGSTSFIGNALIRQLLEQNYEVIAIIRPNSKRSISIKKFKGITIVEAELSELHNLKFPNPVKCESLFHLGWSSDFENARYNLEGQKKNIEYTLGAVELASRYGCKNFIGVGSQAECGRVNQKISTDTADNPETAYAVAKCDAYRKSKEKCEQYGIKQCWPRLLSAYGPNDKERTLIMSCLDSFVHSRLIELTPCEQIWDYIYVDDVADALLRIAMYGKHGVRYPIASGVGKPLKEYVNEMSFIVNKNNMFSGFAKKKYTDQQVMYLVGDISETNRDTGFKPLVSFEEGIRKILHTNFNW